MFNQWLLTKCQTRIAMIASAMATTIAASTQATHAGPSPPVSGLPVAVPLNEGGADPGFPPVWPSGDSVGIGTLWTPGVATDAATAATASRPPTMASGSNRRATSA